MDEDLVMWKGRKLMVLLPSYRTVHPGTHYSLFANYARYGAEKIALDFKDQTIVHEARNILIHRGLLTDAETFIMVDDDMILPCGNPALFRDKYKSKMPERITSRVAFSRLMSHGSDKGIVSALYFGRHPAGKAQVASGFADKKANKDYHTYKYDGLRPELWCGTGCIKIERWVLERLAAEIDNGRWEECKPFANDPKSWKGFFNHIGTAVGEDCSFSVRAKEIGIQTYVDAGLVCLHMGDVAYGAENTTYDT